MRKQLFKILVLAVPLFFGSRARAQTIVAVTGTITDPNGFMWTSATVQIYIVASGTPTFIPCVTGPCNIQNPTTIQTDPFTGQFRANLFANASILPVGSSYRFHVTSGNATIAPPIGTGSVSFDVSGISIVGPGTQDLSAVLSAAAPKLTNISSGGGGGGGGFANTALSNLVNPTAINQNLLPGLAGLFIGNSSNPFADVNTNAVDVFGTPGQGVQFQEGTLNPSDCSTTLTDAIGSDSVTHWLNFCSNALNGGVYSPVTTTLTSSGAPSGTGQVFQLDVDTTNGNFYFWNGSAWVQLGNAITIGCSIAAKSATYTLTVSDCIVNANGTFTVTVPHAISGKRWTVKNVGTGTITVVPDSGTLDGTANTTLAVQYAAIDLSCDGTNCWIY